jgi:hypothetical protein
MLEHACIICSHPFLVFEHSTFSAAIFWQANPFHFWILKIIKNLDSGKAIYFALLFLW